MSKRINAFDLTWEYPRGLRELLAGVVLFTESSPCIIRRARSGCRSITPSAQPNNDTLWTVADWQT